MSQFERTYQEKWSEFSNGNQVVNENTIPFCVIGPDQALEQINRWVKVTGGLFGITLNENARNRLFLISANSVRLTEEANEMTRDPEAARKRHHGLSQAILKRQTKNAQKLVSTIEGFINPFSYHENDIINLVTNLIKAVILEKLKQDICLIEEVGVAKMENFIQERIKTEQVNIWATIKKGLASNLVCLFKTCTCSNIKQSFKTKEDIGIARIVANSRSVMHLQECLCNYELAIVPISLFVADGTMLHCSAKIKLMDILEKITSSETSDVAPPDIPQPNKCVAIIDTIDDVQSMDKPSWIKMCKDLSAHCIAFRQRKYDEYDDLHIVFDRYDIPIA